VHPKFTHQIFTYGATGVSATLVHFLMLTFLHTRLSVPAASSSVIAFLFALSISFFLQRRWVFGADGPVVLEAGRFLIPAFIGSILNGSLVFVFTDVLDQAYWTGFVVATITIPPLTFLANKYWVFGASNDLAQ